MKQAEGCLPPHHTPPTRLSINTVRADLRMNHPKSRAIHCREGTECLMDSQCLCQEVVILLHLKAVRLHEGFALTVCEIT